MKYCLDTNVFIEAWNKYYSYDFFSEYWEKLDQLAKEKIIFASEVVKKEIQKMDDALNQWLSQRDYFFRPIDDDVQKYLKKIYNKEELHKRLVDSSNFRSEADPWVIAHAIAENAIVVTKEEYENNPTERIKIPNVCENMGVEWMNDFDFIRALKLKFGVI